MKRPLIFYAGLLRSAVNVVPDKNYQREISDKILRFHVIANSDSFQISS